MDFAPGGTNIPHHHDNAEEIHYVLRGHGDMVAGGGMEATRAGKRLKTAFDKPEYTKQYTRRSFSVGLFLG
jgi:uncharacterized cupin superfamily protein